MDRQWHLGAVFYELLVRSYADSDGDGIGDLSGLLNRLDHLQDLGVDAVWLLPLFPSPLKDGGYDVSDLRGVHEQLGTLEDLRAVVDAAHARGLRVVMDLLLNHTSDQHPWFQASRTEPDGPYGDFYVWADDDLAHPDVPVVFCDTEPSNWTWDPVRGQYYWHRFFRHQPDLNYDSPAVRAEMLATVRFWLEQGVDGFRLDAVPYLYAREGTSCAHLPETHAFLREVRAVLDADFPEAVLLAEANGSAQEVAGYFGAGDECHLVMHFPLMPQLFVALATGEAGPLAAVVRDTATPPPGAAWATFARNHDELSLEAVTEEERALLYAAYCPEERMRVNVGIGRRLAPLLDHDDDAVLLVTTLLLSLPGTPILYYGDEIGLADDVSLPDRDAVRTPMPWTPDGGFSSNSWTYYPMVRTPEHGPHALNAADQRRDPASLLSRTRHALHVRRTLPPLQGGGHSVVGSGDARVLAVVREGPEDAGDLVLCLANVSGEPATATVDLGAWAPRAHRVVLGQDAVNLRGHVLTASLPGRATVWVELER